jgi:ribosomal protein S6
MAEMSQTEAAAEVSSQANAPKDSRPIYEIGFHVVPTVTEAQLSDAMAALRAQIAKAGGEIIGGGEPTKMTLAYVIERAVSGKREKYSETYFGWVKFVVEERAGIPELESYLQHAREILRYLLIETVREEAPVQRRAVFASNRLEGEVIKKPASAPEAAAGPVSEEDLDKSIEALVQ